tara:strand:- start:628 stop:849 length:222 start_codon:yes stop_codon:yes gene_type:complete
MTLHEAIELVLKAKDGLTTRQLANEINQKKLYQRKNLKPIPTNQIGARVKNHPLWFEKKGNKIFLAQNRLPNN